MNSPRSPRPPAPHRLPLRERKATRVALGPHVLRIRHARSIDPLLDRLTPEEVADHRLPYFGALWPSAIALARFVWRRGDRRGEEVLDLGCGVGLTGIAAAMRGARVVFADVFPEALELARGNAEASGFGGHEYLRLDWRETAFARPFHAILASDLFYESRNHAPLLDLFERCLRPGGFVAVSDPMRPNANPFFEEAARRFEVEETRVDVAEGDAPAGARVALLTRRERTP